MISSRTPLVRALPVLLLFAAGCGDDAPTTPTDTTPATTDSTTVTVTAAPNPAVSTESSDPAYARSVSFVATIASTNTSTVTVRSVSTDVQQSSGGIVVEPVAGTDEVFRFDMRAPGNRVEVNGSLAIPFTIYYTLPNAGREAIVNLTFLVATDAGASGTITGTVNLQ